LADEAADGRNANDEAEVRRDRRDEVPQQRLAPGETRLEEDGKVGWATCRREGGTAA